MAELTERLGFNLADTFTGYVKQLAHFFEGMVGLFADAETLEIGRASCRERV